MELSLRVKGELKALCLSLEQIMELTIGRGIVI